MVSDILRWFPVHRRWRGDYSEAVITELHERADMMTEPLSYVPHPELQSGSVELLGCVLNGTLFLFIYVVIIIIVCNLWLYHTICLERHY